MKTVFTTMAVLLTLTVCDPVSAEAFEGSMAERIFTKGEIIEGSLVVKENYNYTSLVRYKEKIYMCWQYGNGMQLIFNCVNSN